MEPSRNHGSAGWPRMIQGGMGAGVSSWELAGAVAAEGQLGVVSGTALEVIYSRRLQLGDPGGHVRRAFARFPDRAMAERVIERYFVPGGKQAGEPYRGVPMYTLAPAASVQELSVVTNFAEVWLAKERGGGGFVGINYLRKIEMPLLASMYGAMLAGVDFVIVGAGSPHEIPPILTKLARGDDVSLEIKVQYAAGERYRIAFSPRALMGRLQAPVPRPIMLAIVSSVGLARFLAQEQTEPPDGFVIEGPTAGGHNAAPQGPLRLDAEGQPVYGPADEVDLREFQRLGLPFWLAGSYGRRQALHAALAAGATGIQVGTAFALCRESGLASDLKARILRQAIDGDIAVFTDPRVSPTGFPFKVVKLSGTLSDADVYASRRRSCDLGYLRTPFSTDQGGIGYRCPAEPEPMYARKRGRSENTKGRKCLCNALLANIGLGQTRRDGYAELPLVTTGDDVVNVARFLPGGASSYGAADVIASILG